MDVITCTYASYTFQAQHCVQQRLVSVIDTAAGSVKVCSVQIKQMFIVVICVQKNNHSSNPSFDPSVTEQSLFVGASVHSELCLSALHTMVSLKLERSSKEDKAVMHLSHTLSLPTSKKMARQR